MASPLELPEDRIFSGDPTQKRIAMQLYGAARNMPLICPHGHVDPRLFADPAYRFGTPVDLFIIPDHYVLRMLFSHGIGYERLGVPTKDGSPTERDHRKIWQLFAEHYHLFRGTPTGTWLNQEMYEIFDVREKLNGESAPRVYDQIQAELDSPDFTPRTLFARFNVAALSTTDAATDPLDRHAAIRASGWGGRILPTFRPDAVVNIDADGWRANIDALSAVSGIECSDYVSYIGALEQRRVHFRSLGATATDHAAISAYTCVMSVEEARAIFARALGGEATSTDAARFTGHMLVEMARMSTEDGLVMQLHPGSLRNHNPELFSRFGRDIGADIPVAGEFTRDLKPLLDRFGNHPKLSLVLFTLDESTYGRELAPLAGVYPSLKLGPPWWFFDSVNGFARYFDLVMETAGLYNTAGFNDDTRAFCSIPARHDVWRRCAASWLAGLVVRGIADEEDASEMMAAMAYGLAKRTYRL